MAVAAGTAVDQLRGDIDATVAFLRTTQSMPNYTTVVDVQVTALLSRVRPLRGLSVQAGAQLANAWAAGTWTAEQSNAFTTALGGAVAASTYTQRQGRRSCQDIQNFDPYLSISDMEILQGDANAHTKIECVVSRCCKLGLVLPSESSTRMIMAACFAAGVPAATHEEKFGMVKEFKRQLKAKLRRCPDPRLTCSDIPRHRLTCRQHCYKMRTALTTRQWVKTSSYRHIWRRRWLRNSLEKNVQARSAEHAIAGEQCQQHRGRNVGDIGLGCSWSVLVQYVAIPAATDAARRHAADAAWRHAASELARLYLVPAIAYSSMSCFCSWWRQCMPRASCTSSSTCGSSSSSSSCFCRALTASDFACAIGML